MRRLLQIPVVMFLALLLLSATTGVAQDTQTTGDTAAAALDTMTEAKVTEGVGEATKALEQATDAMVVEVGEGIMGFLKGIMVFVYSILGVYLLLTTIGLWGIYSKAGQPGVAAIIPVWRKLAFCQAAGKPAILGILLLPFLFHFVLAFQPVLPFLQGLPDIVATANFYTALVIFLTVDLIVTIGLARRFGKGAGYGVGMWLVPFVFYPMLGLGGATHMVAGMELPEDEEDGAPADSRPAATRGAPARAPGLQQPRIVTDSSRYTVAAILAILAVLMLVAVLALQWYEIYYYESDLPENGTGSAWPAVAEQQDNTTAVPNAPAPSEATE